MWFFSKKLKVKEEDLSRYICVRHKKSQKKLKLNTVCIVPEDAVCVFCYKNKPCEVLSCGKYELNGNSLPNLYKRGGFNKPNRRNYIPDFFYANIWYTSLQNFWLDFEIVKFKIKDRMYGTQKLTFDFKVCLKIVNAELFYKSLLYERPKIRTRSVLPTLCNWFKNDIAKYLKRQGYSIEDYVCYTRGFNMELHQLLCDRFAGLGLEILETDLNDITMPDELMREISDNRVLSAKIHESMNSFDMAMNNDGIKTKVNFERSTEQMQGSIAQKYTNSNLQSQNNLEQGGNYFATNSNVNSGVNYQDVVDNISQNNNSFYESNPNLQNGQSSQNEQSEQFGVGESANIGDNGYSLSSQFQSQTISNDDLQAMYEMADENFEVDTYQTLYGQSSLKVCLKCGKQVAGYVSFCPYCGGGDFKHTL